MKFFCLFLAIFPFIFPSQEVSATMLLSPLPIQQGNSDGKKGCEEKPVVKPEDDKKKDGDKKPPAAPTPMPGCPWRS
jgi:hypothetical protein